MNKLHKTKGNRLVPIDYPEAAKGQRVEYLTSTLGRMTGKEVECVRMVETYRQEMERTIHTIDKNKRKLKQTMTDYSRRMQQIREDRRRRLLDEVGTPAKEMLTTPPPKLQDASNERIRRFLADVSDISKDRKTSRAGEPGVRPHDVTGAKSSAKMAAQTGTHERVNFPLYKDMSPVPEHDASIPSGDGHKRRRKLSRRTSDNIYTLEKQADGTSRLVAYRGTKSYFAAMRAKQGLITDKTLEVPEPTFEEVEETKADQGEKLAERDSVHRMRRFGRMEDHRTSVIIKESDISQVLKTEDDEKGSKQSDRPRQSFAQRVSVVSHKIAAVAHFRRAGKQHAPVGVVEEEPRRSSPQTTYLDLLRLRHYGSKKLLKAFDTMLEQSSARRKKGQRRGGARRPHLPVLNREQPTAVLNQRRASKTDPGEDTVAELPPIVPSVRYRPTHGRDRNINWQNSVSNVRHVST